MKPRMLYKKLYIVFATAILLSQSIIATTAQQKSNITVDKEAQSTKKHKAKLTFIIYMAADNDLKSFAARNIKQMAAIGSNKYIHIVVHLDIRIAGNKKITRRYYIEKNKILHVNAYDPSTQRMDSGQPETLISCCRWAIQDYPADEYALIFWNHGTGALDPAKGRIICPAELFTYNPAINMLELDRSTSILGHIDTIEPEDNSNAIAELLTLMENGHKNVQWDDIEELLDAKDPRGICWDDSAGNYLTNQKLNFALGTIRKKYLGGKKFSIIGFDACLMSMIEVGSLIKKHAHIMVGSQEVELGTGWNYQKVLKPFAYEALNRNDFARHITHVYEETYNRITNDYTQSAIDLDNIELLEENVSYVAELLIQALRNQQGKSVHNAIRASRNKLLCTHFDEPSYIDLHHFMANLEYNLKHFAFKNAAAGKKIVHELHKALDHGRAIIRQIVLANVSGKNLSQARGISIFFPERRIHSSYPKTPFAATNSWATFLTVYIS